MNILIINGPNMNMLGIREPEIYGKTTYPELCARLSEKAAALGVSAELFQSNHEGAIVDNSGCAPRRGNSCGGGAYFKSG